MTTINIAVTQDDLELRPQVLGLTAQLLQELAKPIMGKASDTPMPRPAAPAPAPAAPVPRPEAPAPAVPVTPSAAAPVTPSATPTTAPQITYDQLVNCGRQLMTDPGKGPQVQALLGKYSVAAISALPPEQYAAMAADLRALGGDI